MVIPFLIAALTSLSVSDTDPEILFSKYRALGREIDTVEIWLRASTKGGELASPNYVMKRTVSYRPEIFPAKWQARKTILWADEKTCPQAVELLERLQGLRVPAIKIAEMPSDRANYGINIRADGARYRLVVPGYYPGEPGKIDLSFGVDTPIANWIDEGFRTIASCWQSQRPKQPV